MPLLQRSLKVLVSYSIAMYKVPNYLIKILLSEYGLDDIDRLCFVFTSKQFYNHRDYYLNVNIKSESSISIFPWYAEKSMVYSHANQIDRLNQTKTTLEYLWMNEYTSGSGSIDISQPEKTQRLSATPT
ncbi:hypothetical protein PPL_00408 [Heterostelium album PN500]|uniref:Uncharacterized protein n=1 Tax=Heterostelium pallidum (strain ATCC 26659 / Pp 5 / PN500) TaxID=670386 RepID=D3AWD4_HETP5|nr:hypothetical protein PPL_00408 [Heterostelium album PN500]EFA86607.1 hypothetical protein PPL_00408 [Heterostelium album PN500]|eukprot:XP_020438712.1 hypothetical protein PPL_00408 [Heterostelium album PN500]